MLHGPCVFSLFGHTHGCLQVWPGPPFTDSAGCLPHHRFFSSLIQRAAKMHRRLRGGTMTLLLVTPGVPASGEAAGWQHPSAAVCWAGQQNAAHAQRCVQLFACLPGSQFAWQAASRRQQAAAQPPGIPALLSP